MRTSDAEGRIWRQLRSELKLLDAAIRRRDAREFARLVHRFAHAATTLIASTAHRRRAAEGRKRPRADE